MDAPEGDQPTRAVVERDAGGWTVSYRFAEPSSAFLFDTSHGDYRITHWEPVGDGVELARLHGLDGMFFDAPVRETEFRIRPPASTEGTWPVLRFSDGSEAFYTGQLALLSIEDRAAAEALEGNLGRWRGTQPAIHVEVRTPGPWVTHRGVEEAPLEVVARNGGGPYVYGGEAPVHTSEHGTLVLDPGLPAWLAERVPGELRAVDEALEARWTTPLPQAVHMLAWRGAADPWENHGRSERGQITMSIRGSRYLEPDDEALADLVWFFAHERVHHLQNGSGVPLTRWPLEGGADALATRALVDGGGLDESALDRRYARVFHRCVQALGSGQTLDGPDASYACGDLVSLATRELLPDHDLFAFWERLLALGEGQGARIDGSFYLWALERELDADTVAPLASFVLGPREDPERAALSLLRAVGLDPEFDEEEGLLSVSPSPTEAVGRGAETNSVPEAADGD